MNELTARALQELIQRAIAADGDLVKWSDLLAILSKLKIPDNPAPLIQRRKLSGLDVFNNDAQAGAGGLVSGDLYRTNNGAVQVKI